MAKHFGIATERVVPVLDRLEAAGRVVRGEFRPDGVEREWCDSDVLRQLRRRSLAALRSEVEPVDAAALARFLPAWQGVGVPRRGLDALVEVIGVLQGAALPVSVLESDVLPARLASYSYRPISTRSAARARSSGWAPGHSGAPTVAFDCCSATRRPCIVPASVPATDPPEGLVHDALRAQLRDRGASFWPDLVAAAQRADQPYDDATVLAALWDLVWAGEVTNDSLAPVRGLLFRRHVPASPGATTRPCRAGATVGGRPMVPRGALARASGHRYRDRPCPGPTIARAVRRAHP